MHITTYLVAIFAATTMAIPGTTRNTDFGDYVPTPEDAAIFNQTLPELEKRGHYGWFASYATKDRGCLGGWAPPRPKIDTSNCIKFHPLNNRIKIDWGTWPIGVDRLTFYLDDNCKNIVYTRWKKDKDQDCFILPKWIGSARHDDRLVAQNQGYGI